MFVPLMINSTLGIIRNPFETGLEKWRFEKKIELI